MVCFWIFPFMLSAVVIHLPLFWALTAGLSLWLVWAWAALRSLGVKKGMGHATRNPKFIAESWIEWEICTGSTLYRQGFQYKWMAKLYVKLYAWILDLALPSKYLAEMSSGRRYWEKFGFEIQYRVRLPAPSEMLEVRTIWSPVMPGEPEYCGEHGSAHPLREYY